MSLGQWVLKQQTADASRDVTFQFPEILLKPQETVTVSTVTITVAYFLPSVY